MISPSLKYTQESLVNRRASQIMVEQEEVFCSDSMMKYALRERLERAKKELRESFIRES